MEKIDENNFLYKNFKIIKNGKKKLIDNDQNSITICIYVYYDNRKKN